MAIQFYCTRCRQLLKIASRKAGTEIECPGCRAPQVVPGQQAAAAATAMNEMTAPAEDGQLDAEVAVHGAPPAPSDAPRRRSAWKGSPGGVSRWRAWSPPQGMILYRREVLYYQAALMLLLAVVAFAAGYLIGRGSASPKSTAGRHRAAGQRLLVEGTLVFDSGPQGSAGDEGAVVIALPATEHPPQTLSIQGIRAGEPPPGEDHASVQKIREFGGDYARADRAGAFSLVLPEPGPYRLLLISRRTVRPDGEALDQLDRDQIGRYFHLAADLIGDHKYAWRRLEIGVGSDPIIHNFGPDGRRP